VCRRHLSAQSIAAVDNRVSIPQLRGLVVIASLESVNLVRLAQAIGVHASNATRAGAGLSHRGLLIFATIRTTGATRRWPSRQKAGGLSRE
jgi:DNA-binding MarR family transcriptional regulator